MIKKFLLFLGLLLIPFGFSFAGLQEFDLGQLESITANSSLGYDLRLTANANFLTNDLYKVVQFKGSGQYPSTWTFFWNGTGMYVLNSCLGGYSCNGNILGQGFINYVNIVQYSNINMEYAVSPGFTPINDFLSNSDYNNPDKLLLGGYSDLQSASLCFVYSNLDKAVCFGFDRANWNNCSGQPQYCTNGQLSYITNSQNLDVENIASLGSIATVSPFVDIPWTPNPGQPISSGYAITNSGVIIAFDNMGYNKAICYGGVSAGTGSESYRTLIPGTGYNLFQLYNIYNPYNLSLRDWYNYYRDGYYDNPTVSFTGSVFVIDGTFRMPLFGLFAFSDKFVSLFPTDDILEYCDVLLNKDPNSYYTGDYKDEVIGFVIRSGKYSLSGSTWQTYNGPLSMLSGSDREMSYRDFFNSISNNFANSFGDIPLNIVGVVPKYILMFMFALIFIRMISK